MVVETGVGNFAVDFAKGYGSVGFDMVLGSFAFGNKKLLLLGSLFW